MIQYKRLRNSGIAAYEIDTDSIHIQFGSGRWRNYLYKVEKIGQSNFKRMTALAKQGHGLNSFINRNRHVKHGYSRKW